MLDRQYYFGKKDHNAEKRFKRLKENKKKWEKELELEEKLIKDFLAKQS